MFEGYDRVPIRLVHWFVYKPDGWSASRSIFIYLFLNRTCVGVYNFHVIVLWTSFLYFLVYLRVALQIGNVVSQSKLFWRDILESPIDWLVGQSIDLCQKLERTISTISAKETWYTQSESRVHVLNILFMQFTVCSVNWSWACICSGLMQSPLIMALASYKIIHI